MYQSFIYLRTGLTPLMYMIMEGNFMYTPALEDLRHLQILQI